jgi:hypothetical protein
LDYFDALVLGARLRPGCRAGLVQTGYEQYSGGDHDERRQGLAVFRQYVLGPERSVDGGLARVDLELELPLDVL